MRMTTFNLLALDSLAEERIVEAMRRGDFENLPGAGAPLDLDEPPLVPEEVRAAYRILKNAGLVPREVLDRRAIADLEREINRELDNRERSRLVQKLALLRAQLGMERAALLHVHADYERRILERLGEITED